MMATTLTKPVKREVMMSDEFGHRGPVNVTIGEHGIMLHRMLDRHRVRQWGNLNDHARMLMKIENRLNCLVLEQDALKKRVDEVARLHRTEINGLQDRVNLLAQKVSNRINSPGLERELEEAGFDLCPF